MRLSSQAPYQYSRDDWRGRLGFYKIVYLQHVNIAALLAGIITIYLVFFGGPLIRFTSSAGDVSFGFDEVKIVFFGVEGSLDFLNYLYISAKLSYLIAGISLVAGALSRDPETSTSLIGFKLPSVTGLILTLAFTVISTVVGVLTSEGLTTTLDIIVFGQVESVTATLKPTFSPTVYLTLTANILAITGRKAAAKLREVLFNEELGVAQIIPIYFPLLP